MSLLARIHIMKYKVTLRRTEEGYSISCPGLPGCWSQGDSEEEALQNIVDAITAYLSAAEDIALDDDVEDADLTIES
jgi:predicted RNase H-like HicB family nuclease